MYKNLNYKNIDNEIWKDIKGFENLYQVSNLGRVRSVFTKKKDKNGKIYNHKPIILKQSFTSTGYLKVRLNNKDYKVHRLVAYAFLKEEPNRNIINHKDFNPLNNKVENIEWCTQRENIAYNVANGKNFKKYNFNQDNIIDLYKKGKTAKEIATLLNISKHIVYYIVHKNNINRKNYKRKSKYIDLEILKNCFKLKMKNKDICKLYNIPTEYIARRKYQFKKGEI